MISITLKAAQQIRHSAEIGNIEVMPLRIAVQKLPDNALHYAMGFDQNSSETDTQVESEGIKIVVAMDSKALLEGMTIDYVELDNGEWEFVFLNPNDPNYQSGQD